VNPDLLYRIALTAVPNIGPTQAKVLVDHFGEAANIFNAKRKELAAIEGIGEVRAKAIKVYDNYHVVEKEIAFIEKHHITPLFLTDAAYPRRLLHCYDPPTVLYYRGNAELNNPKVVSIIGTRANTSYGKHVTESLVEGLAEFNALIVSGLAFGVDALAHKAAVHYKLPTIGVLAHGLDTLYPPEHKSLAKDILHQGGLLTEFPRHTKADKHNFPRRNRIVAGMADATVVIETAEKGGSMITAELAYNYNRDVFAVPGKTTDQKSEGCLKLIQQNKAVVYTGVDHLVDVLGWREKEKQPSKRTRELFIDLTEEERTITNLLSGKDPVHIDEIFLKSNLSSSSVASAILNLELQNVIASLPGKLYRLN
jgi:DNA processing protein